MTSPSPHWSDGYYGELYYDSAADLLTPGLSAAEALLVERLLRVPPGALLLDAGCGHGRHALPLAARGHRVVGLDRSAAYLARASASGAAGRASPAFLRADLRALPLREGRFDGALSWYSSLFMFGDEENAACLAALGRTLRPGARMVVQHGNPLALAERPHETFRRVLPDGSVVQEESSWDAARGVDRCARTLTRPDATVLAGTAELRYYSPREWGPLAAAVGLRCVELTATPRSGAAGGGEPTSASPDLIAVLERSR
jgi:SAM-dependent methyltransferase